MARSDVDWHPDLEEAGREMEALLDGGLVERLARLQAALARADHALTIAAANAHHPRPRWHHPAALAAAFAAGLALGGWLL